MKDHGAEGLGRRDLLKAGSLLWAPGQERAPAPGAPGAAPDIVIENDDFRLVIGGDATARSLIEKSSGQECLVPDARTPVFRFSQCAPLPGQLILRYLADYKTIPADSVRRDGDRLRVRFAGVPHAIVVRLKIAPRYVAFTLEQAGMQGPEWSTEELKKTPIDEMVFLELPLRPRTNFGEWLNVMWDGRVAVNLLAADPWCRVGSQARERYRLVRASAEDRVRPTGVTAALIAAPTPGLLDRIGEVERDFNLPRGAESRRRKEYRYSYYWAGDMTPANLDRHIEFARKGGFPMLMISYRAFTKTAGHFPWRPEYPGGIEDLRAVVRKIRSAGLIPGLHIHYSKAEKLDPYVSGTPDGRLNVVQVFTLAEPLDRTATTIAVEENPAGVTLDDQRRFLRVGRELISYASYSTTPPYRFTGCQRAQLGSQAGAYEPGTMFGVLDVDTWPIFVRFNQNTSIQEEVAARLVEFYRTGFEFLYFDGAEDVHAPYWYTTAWAQWVVWRSLDRAPWFAEAAQLSHFNWHMISRGNAYDAKPPELTRQGMRMYQESQVARMARDFSAMDFGWLGYQAPGGGTIGTQPDMVEYAASRAAGWDCPFSLLVQRLAALETHPRTPDNLEVMRRWQEAVLGGALTSSQKEALRDPAREHLLLRNRNGGLEPVPYEHIEGAAGGDRPIRAFLFERGGTNWVVYWHTSGKASLEVALSGEGLRLWDEPDGRELSLKRGGSSSVLPAEGRRYLQCAGHSKQEVARAFRESKVIDG